MLISEHHSEFDTTLNVLDHYYLMMDIVTGEPGRASDSGQSTSQSSRLCQACLSVFMRDELEVGFDYFPHHSSLDAFIEAAQARCYICSSVFLSLPSDKQESLRLLASGKEPNQTSLEKKQLGTGINSFSPEKHMHSFRDDLEGRLLRGRMRFVSFTGMGFFWPSRDDPVDIRVRLNPLYETYFPPQMAATRDSLRKMWVEVADHLSTDVCTPFIDRRSDP